MMHPGAPAGGLLLCDWAALSRNYSVHANPEILRRLAAEACGNLSCVHEFALPSSMAQKTQAVAVMAAQPAPALPEPAPAEAPCMPSPIKALYSLPPPPDLGFLDAPPSGADASGTKKIFGYELKSVLWLLAGTLIPLGLVVATSMLSPSVSRSAARSDPLPQFLRLSVDQSGRSLTLRWDRNAAALQNAVRAVLHIEDGDSQAGRHLALGSGHRAGAVLAVCKNFRPHACPRLRCAAQVSGENVVGPRELESLTSTVSR